MQIGQETGNQWNSVSYTMNGTGITGNIIGTISGSNTLPSGSLNTVTFTIPAADSSPGNIYAEYTFDGATYNSLVGIVLFPNIIPLSNNSYNNHTIYNLTMLSPACRAEPGFVCTGPVYHQDGNYYTFQMGQVTGTDWYNLTFTMYLTSSKSITGKIIHGNSMLESGNLNTVAFDVPAGYTTGYIYASYTHNGLAATAIMGNVTI